MQKGTWLQGCQWSQEKLLQKSQEPYQEKGHHEKGHQENKNTEKTLIIPSI
jgi:hypothetical protein